MSNIINFYEQLPKVYKGSGKAKYKNYSKVRIEVPCRMLIAGVSGAGKSNFVLNVISQVNAFDRVYLLAKQLDQPLYKWLIEILGKGNIIASDKIADLPALDEFDKNISNLVIFDDFICDDAKTQKRIAEIYVRGRHMNVSPIYLTQSYFATDKMIRRNSDYIAIVKINTKKDLARTLVSKRRTLSS